MPYKDPAKRAAQKRAWAKAHPEWYAAYMRMWRKAPGRRERENAQARQYYAANHQKRVASVMKSRKRSPEAYQAYRSYFRLWLRKRRAKEAGAAGECSLEQWRARSAMWGGRCWLRLPGCLGDGKQIDHVIPVMRGGTNWPANLRPACKHCNRAKGAKDWRLFVWRR